MLDFIINGKKVSGKKGETILQVARRNGIYIPTMCYLEKVSPIGSCRLCLVEVKYPDSTSSDLVLSCQTPAIANIEVQTDTEKLFKHRQNIIKFYNVNHPLECGVCDKSGACDLQNKNLEFAVNSQEFAIKEQYRKIEDWNFIQYDPSLCIVCEKCVSTCNEVIGDDSIKVKFGGYSSSIITKTGEPLDCTFCGECIAVCPVGALISKDFKYSANSWELTKIPSTCSHCSSGCQLYYEVKHGKIRRVTNDFETETLCGAGRFAFDFATTSQSELSFDEVVERFKNSDAILFNSEITNEEAKILNEIAKKIGAKLVNPDARNYQKFLNAFSKTSGTNLYNGTLNNIENSNQIIVFGSKVVSDNPGVRYKLTQAYKKHRAFISYFHPIYEPILQNTIKQFVNYEVGTEDGVTALLADLFIGDKKDLDLDIGYLSGETNVAEEELAQIKTVEKRAKNKTLIIGADLIAHENSENIAKFIGLIQKYSDWKVVIIPTQTNTLGVSQICDISDLDYNSEFKNSVGYNIKAQTTISAFDGDFSVPALNQQEGTFTTIDKKVVKLYPAVDFNGKTLNDIASEILDTPKKWTINWTKEIFDIEFDDLENLSLEIQNISADEVEIDEIDDLPSYDGTVIYFLNPPLQFNPATAKALSKHFEEPLNLIGSEQFARASKLKNGDKVKFEVNGISFERIFKLNNKLKGVVGINPFFDKSLDIYKIISNYRFAKVKIEKI